MATAEVDYGDDGISEHESTGNALESLTRGEVDTQITTAKRYPRSIKRFVNEAKEMVQLTEEVAGECMYALKRSGKTIEGPSARFAEIIASAWGNCKSGARIIAEDDRFVTSQGVFFDLQRNVSISYEVRRRITDKNGNKYGDDMVGVTSNAASSIAMRNAVLKGIPKAFWKPIYDAARDTAIGDAQTLSSRRELMLTHFGKMGVTPEQVFGMLEVQGVEDITLDNLAILKGVATAIKDGDTTVDEAFGRFEVPQTGSKARPSKANDLLNKRPEPERQEIVEADPVYDAEPAAEVSEQPQGMSADEQTLAGFEQLLETTDSQIKCESFRDKGIKDHPHLEQQLVALCEARKAAIKGSRGEASNK